MEFGTEKCAMLIMKRGKRQMTEGIEMLKQEKIRTLGEKKNYKYSVILKADIKQKEMKNKEKIISDERENFSKRSCAAEISSKE